MVSNTMDASGKRFLDALRCSLHGQPVQWDTPFPADDWRRLYRMGQEHHVVPLLVEATYLCSALPTGPKFRDAVVRRAKQLTVHQARRTADFLLLYDTLSKQGLSPAVMKGIVCRNLYPHPEQRPSVDEDLLINPEEFSHYHEALIEYGLTPADPKQLLAGADEVTYLDEGRHFCIELHTSPFPPDSAAYGDCTGLFDGVLDRTVTVQIEDVSVRTLAPTDHLLYLICHAYKHFLHSGVGIRQVCDIGMFAQAYGGEIDWAHILESCQSIRIDRFAAAIFRIAQRYLGFEMPAAFSGIHVDESDLLEDMLSGGLYGAADPDRLHSSTLTLDAVAASKSGKRRGGVLRSVFLPLRSLTGRYPYLRHYPVLLPVAWGQRIWGYLTEKKDRHSVHPSQSVRIGNARIALLREYGIID